MTRRGVTMVGYDLGMMIQLFIGPLYSLNTFKMISLDK